MKLKSLLLGLGVTAGLLSACTTEDLADNNGTEEGKEISVSLLLATGDPATKAASGYQYATEKEIKITNCVVAIFKMDGEKVGELIGSVKPFVFTNGSDASFEGKPAYKLPGVFAKTGKVRLLVVANAENSTYTSFTKWSDFEKTFIGNELKEEGQVKVGILDRELIAPVTGDIVVSLSQLSAKVKLSVETSDPAWSFTLFKITVDKINKKTDLILTAPNKQEQLESWVMQDGAEGFTDRFFYTYENPMNNPVKITLEGILKENGGVSETKKYSVELNKTLDNGKLKEGLCHGTLYAVSGKIDVLTRTINFTWEILPWSSTLREVNVEVSKPKFLVVRDTEMMMPNMTNISTWFDSSSPVKISDVKVTNGKNQYANTACTVTPDGGNSGNLSVKSPLPVNFVPKYISFTVTNTDGLSQSVTVVQYPPLYIEANTSIRKPTGSDSQNNDKMYQIKTLVADLSLLSTNIKDDYELNESGFVHSGSLSDRQKVAESYVNELRNKGVSGFPLTEVGVFGGTTNVYNNSLNFTGVSAKSTLEGAENNYRISPNFILASQNGVNSINENSAAKTNCALYYESVKNADGSETKYEQGTWRMPTRSELMLIDVLQNTLRCEVKGILEGIGYRNGLPEKLDMMDRRVSGNGAVRCVRDIKL